MSIGIDFFPIVNGKTLYVNDSSEFSDLCALPQRQQFVQLMWHDKLLGAGVVTAGKNIRYYTPRAVEKNIETHAMYKTENK